MVTFLSGGTGTPKLLAGMADRYGPGEPTVVANTGDDVELGGLLVCPDLDTVLYLAGDQLDTDTWWGIEGDTAKTHERLQELADGADIEAGPRYLDEAAQRNGRRIARWRRFSGVAEFMHIGDRDRAVHVTRTGLVDEGRTLTEAIETLASSFDASWRILPMSDDPVATMVRTPDGPMHFQEFWVWHEGDPQVEAIEFRGSSDATATETVRAALEEPVIIGPSNPVTSIGPMLAIDGIRRALESTPVVAVSPFVEDEVFSGPADKLMRAAGYEPSTSGVAAAYPFADAFVLDEEDGTSLDRPIRRTDTEMSTPADAARVGDAIDDALAEVVE